MIKLVYLIREIQNDPIPYGAWMDKDGKIYPADYMDHETWAFTYCKQNNINFDTSDKLFPSVSEVYKKLFDLGFIRIVFYESELTTTYQYKRGYPPNRKQIQSLKNITIEYQFTTLFDDVHNRRYNINDL